MLLSCAAAVESARPRCSIGTRSDSSPSPRTVASATCHCRAAFATRAFAPRRSRRDALSGLPRAEDFYQATRHPRPKQQPLRATAAAGQPALEGSAGAGRKKGVPLWVMLPLDTVGADGSLHQRRMLEAGLPALKAIGVTGVMFDVWWGVVETAPKQYNWKAYSELIELVASFDLKIQAVMSFHACGCNVGDSCTISLPEWVIEIGEKNPDIYYTDLSRKHDDEYLTLGVDEVPLFKGRTAVELYRDLCASFVETFKHRMGNTIQYVAIGLGPAGELRYPSYPEFAGTWRFPGTGEFQMYDKYMLEKLRVAAVAAGKPEWGNGGPHDAGGYNGKPHETGFFNEQNGSWQMPYGEFFLRWYCDELTAHGDRVLSACREAFEAHGDVVLMAKLPGIHWWYNTRSHAAELVAGIYNSEGNDGYRPILRMLRRNGVALNFTCAEMLDNEQPRSARCSPQQLLRQVAKVAAEEGVPFAAENALARFDRQAYDTVIANAFPPPGSGIPPFVSFTYLRKGGGLFHPSNWHAFVRFARQLAQEDPDEKDGTDLEGLYNVAGEAATVYRNARGAQHAR